MSYPLDGTHDVKINGTGYIIDFKRYRRGYADELNQKMSIGEPKYSDLSNWSFASWADFRGGDAQVKHDDPLKFHSSDGIDPRGNAQGDLGFNLLHATEQIATTNQLGRREQDRILINFGGYLLIFGMTYATCHAYDGTHRNNHRAKSGKGFIGVCNIGKYVFAITKSGDLFRCSISAKTNKLTVKKVTTLDLSSYGTEEHEVTAMTGFNGKIALGVGHELLSVSASTYAITDIGDANDGEISCFVDLRGAFKTNVDISLLYFGVTKFKNIAGTRTKIYSGASINVSRLTAGDIEEIYKIEAPFHIESMGIGARGLFYAGGWKEDAEIKGRIYQYPQTLVKELEDSTNSYNSAILDMRSGMEVLVGYNHFTGIYCIMESGGGFPAWKTSLTADSDNIVSGIEIYNGGTYFAVRSGGIYRVDSSNYVTTAEIILSHFTAKLDLIDKLFNQIRLELKTALSATQTIAVYVKEDEDTAWSLIGTMDNEDGTSWLVDFADAYVKEGVDIKLVLTQGATETPPRITAIVMRYQESSESKEAWLIPIYASDRQNKLRNGAWDTVTAATKVSALRTLRDNKNVVAFVDVDEVSHQVLITRCPDSVPVYRKGSFTKRFIDISLLEV